MGSCGKIYNKSQARWFLSRNGGWKMKLKNDLPVIEIDGDSIMVFASEDDNSFRGMLRSNPSAKFIIDCLAEETDEEGILEKLKDEFEGDEAEMREDIKLVVANLRLVGALEE